MQSRAFIIFFAIFVFPVCGYVHSQSTTATQGPIQEDPSSSVGRFHSPMVLATPFPAFEPKQLGKWLVLDDMADYECDGVFVRRLKARAKRWGKGFLVSIDAFTFTYPGLPDKAVHLRFQVMSGEAILAEGEIRKLKAEEGDSGHGSTAFTVPQGRLGDGPVVLRTTVTVAGD